jgi:hypothetical protein
MAFCARFGVVQAVAAASRGEHDDADEERHEPARTH